MNLDSVRVGWLDSFLNDGKKEDYLGRIPQKCPLSRWPKVQKMKKVDGRVLRTWQGAPKTVFFLHSYDEKNHSKKIPKKKKSAGVQRCWNKIALVNYLEDT